MNFLDYSGLQRFLNRLKAIIPTKTSDIQNDSGFLTQHNPVDNALSGTSENAVQNKVVKDALDGKANSSHTHTKSDITDFPTLATVATSGDYTDLTNKPSINDATLTIQKNSTSVATFTANASSNVTANITVPTAVSELTNDSGYLTSASSLDSSKLTGTIDIARLPAGALERLVTVADQTARYALTVNDVQLGDTVKQLDTGVMYIVTDVSKLSQADGYTEYTAGSATSVPWSGVTGKPADYTPSSHTHGNITNDGKLPTASKVVISDSNKLITTSSVTDTELGYLSGVTSSVQTQLNGKAASDHVHGNITNDGKVGTTANIPLITGTGGVVQAGSFGNAANTFCEGNDSRLSDARTPVSHTHVTADVTDLLSDTHTWTSQQSYNSDLNLNYASTDVDDIVNSVAGSAVLDNFVHMTGNETVNGIKSFPDGIVANVTGSATSATQDGSGNVITSTYGSLTGSNTWSANNTFTSTITTKANVDRTVAPASDTNYGYIVCCDKNGSAMFRVQGTIKTDLSNVWEMMMVAPNNSYQTFFRYTINATSSEKELMLKADSVIPDGDNKYSLGTTTKKWENVYANKYYATMQGTNNYGTYRILTSMSSSGYGVFQRNDSTNWYLMVTDKNNALGTWSTARKYFPIQVQLNSGRTYINGEIRTAIDSYTEGTAPQSDIFNSFANLQDSNGSLIASFQSAVRTDEYADFNFWLNRNNITKGFRLRLSSDGATSSVVPTNDSETDLGTTSARWKSFNGLNPGALSLPGEWISIDTTSWGNTGGNSAIYVAPFDGWLGVTVISESTSPDITEYVAIARGSGGSSSQFSYWAQAVSTAINYYPSSYPNGCVFMPVLAGVTYYIRIKAAITRGSNGEFTGYGIIHAAFFKAQGNV